MELTAAELWSESCSWSGRGSPSRPSVPGCPGSDLWASRDESLLMEAPDKFHGQWLEDRYGPLLEDAAERVLGRPLRISFSVGAGATVPFIPSVEVNGSPDPPRASPARSGSPPSIRSGPRLNPRYSFQRFVVGDDNQLAAAACVAVSEKPARMYNPLFLYGGVGLGKTHLMHAIGNAILEADDRKNVAYAPCEHFVNELVTAIQEGTTPDFRRHYRRMDLLLMDDVHFLRGKERTQEEFFHTFNALFDAHKQIVLTSDRPPKEIPGLEERLISRFEWGLVADIKPPDYETRVAILRKKANDDSLTLDPQVIDYIARSCTSSVRELEGAVIKLLAYSSLKNVEISVSMAQNALQGVLARQHQKDEEPVTPSRIQDLVAGHWTVTRQAICSPRRTKDLTVPRQVAMYLMRGILDLSLVQIGSHFGGRDHSTVIHSIRKVEETMQEDEDFRSTVTKLREDLSHPVKNSGENL
jgi:chromosomal replication initiator protein